MKNKELDDTVIRCPNCQREYPGKHINNQYESQGICDWCALGMMLRDNPAPPMMVETLEFDGLTWKSLGKRTTEPPPPKPSETN